MGILWIFSKKKTKKHEYSIFLYIVFSTFFLEQDRKMIFFLFLFVLVHIGISTPFKHTKRRKNFLESLKSVTCSRFHQDMFAANDNMSNELLKNDT